MKPPAMTLAVVPNIPGNRCFKTAKTCSFSKGKSSNPTGFRKRDKSIETLISECLSETVTITENGKSKKTRKGHAAAKQLVNRAAKGEPGPLKMIFQLSQPPEAHSSPQDLIQEARTSLAEILLGHGHLD